MSIVLSRTRPCDGYPNPYRTRWCEVEGVTFEVSSDSLDGAWSVSLDVNLLIETVDRNRYASVSTSDRHVAIRNWISSPDNWGRWEFRLPDARQAIADLVASPEWPRIKAAYLAILATAKGQ